MTIFEQLKHFCEVNHLPQSALNELYQIAKKAYQKGREAK
jgi:hypothetical protein